MFFGIFGFLSLNAQLFTVSLTVEDSLTQGEQDFRQRMLDSAYFLTSQSVEIADFQAILNVDSLDFTLPNATSTYRAVKTFEYSETDYHYDYLWTGTIENLYPGYVLLAKKDNLIGGFIQIQDDFYAIVPTGDNEGLFMKANPITPDPVCKTEPTTEEVVPEPCEEQEMNTCAAEVHALILITPEQRAYVDGLNIDLFTQHILYIFSLEAVNMAYVNSDIPNKRLVYSFTDYDALNISGSLEGDLNILVNEPVANQLREDYRADVVAMLGGNEYLLAGKARSEYPSPDNPYCIVSGWAMFYPNWTLAHEITHFMRTEHNSVQNCLCVIAANEDPHCSHGWRIGQTFDDPMTIMGLRVGNTDEPKILHFSNPNISFNGKPTGLLTGDYSLTPPLPPAYNAKTIRNSACVVTDYRPSPFFSARINTPHTVCESSGSFAVSGIATEAIAAYKGHPPYTFLFSTTTNNCLVTSINPTGASATINFVDFPGTSSITVTVTVTSSDGAVTADSETIVLSDCFTGGGGSENIGSDGSISGNEKDKREIISQNRSIQTNGYNIFPNPTSGELKIIVPNNRENTWLTMLDLTGKELKTISGESGQKYLQLDISDLPDGEYFLRIKDSKETVTVKFLKMSK